MNMSDDYTPTTEEVRRGFGEAFTGDGSIVDQDAVAAENRAEFDRWLAAHDAEVRAEGVEWEYRRVRPDGRPVYGPIFDLMPDLDYGWSAERRPLGPWIPVEKGVSDGPN